MTPDRHDFAEFQRSLNERVLRQNEQTYEPDRDGEIDPKVRALVLGVLMCIAIVAAAFLI